jgi:hypothetical protein
MASASKKTTESVLREEVANSTIEDGTIIAFVFAEYPNMKKKRDQQRHRHVSIYSASTQHWYSVGEGGTYVSRDLGHREFIELLASPAVSSAELVTLTTAIKP